jgi:poly(3-hydroxybutyrate) depolymerase
MLWRVKFLHTHPRPAEPRKEWLQQRTHTGRGVQQLKLVYVQCMCSNTRGTVHRIIVDGTERCYSTVVGRRAVLPAPVLIVHHGLESNAQQFCTGAFARQAEDRGVALICTVAQDGRWRFGDPRTCEMRSGDSTDLLYISKVVDELRGLPGVYDELRMFQAGFSQGALVAAYSSFCIRQFVGFGQAASSFMQGKVYVSSRAPNMRICVWCKYADHASNLQGTRMKPYPSLYQR